MNRKTFSLVTSLAILTSSLSPIWAAGKDFTYNNLNQNLPIKAPVDETKEVEEKIDLPLVTETLPDESIRNKYARIIFVPETKNVDDVMEYGKLLDKEGKEVSLNDISYNDNVVKGKEYYALKSASWREIKNYKENDKQVLYVRKADNNESDPEKKKIHKFLTWKLGARKDFPFFADYKLKFEKYSIDNPVIFQSVFEPLPYFYSISHLENFDADGYKLTNSSDEYYCVEFLSSGGNKDKGVGFRFNDSQIKYACKEANNSKNVVLHIRWNSGDYRFGDYKPQTVNIKDRTFWYWTYDKNSHEIVKDDTKLSISRPTFMAKYIVDYLGVDKDFDLKNNPIPEGCHELKLEVEDGYLFNSVPYEKFAVRDGLSLANISVLENLILKDKNNINYDDDVAWYDRYKKIDNLSEFKINSDTVLTARRVRDYESEKFIPEVKEIEVNKDQDVTLEKLKSGIVNLPKNLDRIEIKTYPDTSEVGEGKATLKLIFTDTSSKEVEVPVKVIEKISGGEITPIPTIKVDDIIKEEVPYHGQINLLDNIKNLPGGAEVKDLSGSIDTKRPGTYTGKVRVTFKDGSSRIVEVPVEVSKSLADSHEAQVKKIEVNKDEDVTLEKLKFGIVNLPKNLDKIEVKTYPDTSEVGEGKAILKLIFTDTSSKEVVIPVKVINIIDAGIVTPVPEIKAEDIIKEEVPYNGEINLLDNIKNLPDGAKVEDISDPIDTKIPGTYKGKIKVIFKDESSRIVEIPVEVSEALADSYTPQVKKIEVNKDELLTREKLESGIVNLPKNLDKIEIKTYPDTSEVGEGKAT
ncbi:MAG: Rib/alpha-like domain-containing protein, partial [Peptoniphilus harei]